MTVTVIGDNTGDDYAGTEDAQIKEGAATTNYGSSGTMETTKYAANDHTHSLLSFSGLSNIAATEDVSAVTLGLYQTTASGTYALKLSRILRNWVEAQATWNIWSTSNNWTTAGGLSTGNDIASLNSVTASIDATVGAYKALSMPAQFVADIEDFIDGTYSNYGHHIQRSDAGEDSGYKGWKTSEDSFDNKPYLSVTHAPGGGGGSTLAAGTLSMMGMGI